MRARAEACNALRRRGEVRVFSAAPRTPAVPGGHFQGRGARSDYRALWTTSPQYII